MLHIRGGARNGKSEHRGLQEERGRMGFLRFQLKLERIRSIRGGYERFFPQVLI